MSVVRHFYSLANFRLRLATGVHYRVFAFDQGPLVRLVGTVYVKALPVLTGRVVQGAVNTRTHVGVLHLDVAGLNGEGRDRKSTRLNSSHVAISYAVFCLKKTTHASQGQRTA